MMPMLMQMSLKVGTLANHARRKAKDSQDVDQVETRQTAAAKAQQMRKEQTLTGRHALEAQSAYGTGGDASQVRPRSPK